MSEIISENNDLGGIAVDVPDFDGGLEQQIAALRQRFSWDAAEMGLTLEQAIANLRAADTPEKRAKVVVMNDDYSTRRRQLEFPIWPDRFGPSATISIPDR